MACSKTIYVVLLVVALSLVVDDAEAGWKFWKKKDSTTTETPGAAGSAAVNPEAVDPNTGNGKAGAAANPEPARPNTGNGKPGASGNAASAANNPAPGPRTGNANPPGSPPGSPSIGTRGAIAGAANPGLAIGVANSGANIRNNAQPQRPNPGTEVGRDIPGSRPANPATGGATSGQGYRDFAIDLTGAGDGTRQGPKVPSQGPALAGNGGQQPAPGSRPSSPAPSPSNKPGQAPPAVGPRPGSPSSPQPSLPSGQASGQGQGSKPVATSGPQPGGVSGGTQTSTLHVGSLNPGQSRSGSPSSGYGSPGNSPAPGSSPTSGKSWADVAGGGTNAKPNSPSPAPRPGSLQPGQTQPQGRPTNLPGQPNPGQSPGSGSGLRTGAAVAGGAAAGAVAAGAAGTTYSSNPIYSKGKTVTDDDLIKLSEALFIKDTNNAYRYITLNLQKKTTSSDTTDQAPQPLLTVDPQALRIPTIEKVLTIYDNYKLDSRVGEYISPAQRAEESLLVDTFLSTNVMSAAMRFLADKGVVRKEYYEYKDTLRRLWFNLYSRGGDGKIGSSGFEHVFLTELKLGTEVSGLHNWIYFNAEEVAKRADYLGYIAKEDLGNKAAIVKFHAKHNNIDKPVTTMFIGTSPELEMALYTVCFMTRQDRPCGVSLGGKRFNIVTHKFRYRGNDLIGSAYPEI
ncbi:poly(U)-specific endoribonuclease homolog [Venturia canescens]|uniref:poly(U)-specific endoribonuclease homolog n=1 Tax=Venturia canescens TaxID=32260 RepID=UPI001C9D326A|nr:poly(U)-specific endoribonuclease homolog [Venturia canescens]